MQKPMTSVRARALAVGSEYGERIARNRAVVPGALQRRLDGAVLLHQADRVLEVAVLDLALAQRALPEGALARRSPRRKHKITGSVILPSRKSSPTDLPSLALSPE